MNEAKWVEICQRFGEVGLLPMGGEVRERLLGHPDITQIVNQARLEQVTGLLGPEVLEGLITRMPIKDGIGSNVPVSVKSFDSLPPSQNSINAPTTPTSDLASQRFRRHDSVKMHEGFFGDAREHDVDIEVMLDISGKSVTEGRMEDIVNMFNNRLTRLREMIERSGLKQRIRSISDVLRDKQKYSDRENKVTIVGLVSEPRNIRSGNLQFVLEDKSGELLCQFTKDEKGRFPDIANIGLMPDDVIGVTGNILVTERGQIFLADKPHFPPLQFHKTNSSESGVSAAFLSDVHYGSKTFLSTQWEKMVKWFHTDPIARSVKYFVLAGDVVDGIGVFPGHEKELEVVDVFEQYSNFARMLEELPSWVEVVILPGNHDLVRPAEPQPKFKSEITEEYNSTTFVGNPAYMKLDGVSVLAYHGKSIDDFVTRLRNVSYGEPVVAMKEMLRRRHLAPTWGGKTPLSPEPVDHMVIGELPDIFVTGHVHGHASERYKGISLVHASTWQDQTEYQRTMGFQPQPAILTVVNLTTHEHSLVPFA